MAHSSRGIQSIMVEMTLQQARKAWWKWQRLPAHTEFTHRKQRINRSRDKCSDRPANGGHVTFKPHRWMVE